MPEPLLDARGNERPRFVGTLPDDPALAPLVAAFERGDYAFVRAHAERVAREAASEEVRLAALDLRRRIDPDPLAVLLLGASALLLALLTAWAYLR